MTDTEKDYPLKSYSDLEEKLNVISHAFGIVASVVAMVLMLVKVGFNSDGLTLFAVLVYGGSLIVLYSASTLFHSATELKRRYRLNVFDHSAIYALIAGTYTPFTLLAIKGDIGWLIFGLIWLTAFGGIVLKLFYTGRFRILSTIMYVVMGWMAIFAIKPLNSSLESTGFILLMAGGAAYTIGAALYAIKKVPYNHAIFHVFVLAGSLLHFLSVYYYVL